MQGILGSVLPIIIVFGIFWFLVLRPQKKRQQERQDMLSQLEVGNEVVTIGGIKGVIREINEHDLKLEIASDVEVEVTRQSIGRVKQQLDNAEDNQE